MLGAMAAVFWPGWDNLGALLGTPDRMGAAHLLRAWLTDHRRRALVAARRPDAVLLCLILLAGLALRAVFVLRWRPALLGFPDSAVYIQGAHIGLFGNPLRVDGYGVFLRAMHGLRAHLAFAIRAQHLLGLVSGVLLFSAVRRAGLPRGLGLIPAAIVVLSGDEIFIEHAPLSEPLFVFLIALGVYALVRTWRDGFGWALLGGISLGAATDVRSLGGVLTAVMIVTVGLIYEGRWRGRLLRVAVTVAAAAVPIAAYLVAHKDAVGDASFTTAGNFNLYSRVAPFADCSKFTPPAGTRDLCIHTPVSQRPGSNAWVFTRISPAVQAYGEPDVTPAKRDENARLQAFAEAAIIGEPLTYLKYVGRDLVRIVDPSYSSSPFGNRGVTGTGYGQTPEQLTNYYFDPRTSAGLAQVAAYYYSDGVVQHSIGLLRTYERDTRIEGPVMAVLLALALLSPLLATGRRRAALLFLAATVVLLAGPPFLVDYDYRYVIPGFGVLGCSAAIGGWGVYVQGGRLLARRRHGDHDRHDAGVDAAGVADAGPRA
jgi:hypothetical protein